MKYIAKRHFNNYIPGMEVENPHESWIKDELVLAIEDEVTFQEKLDQEVLFFDPEVKLSKPRGKEKKNVLSNS